MKVRFEHFELSTEHPSSSYGVPVLLLDGKAYGPLDYPAWPDNMALGLAKRQAWSAARAVRATPANLSQEQWKCCNNFIQAATIAAGVSLDELS